MTLVLMFGTFCVPSFGAEESNSTQLYNEASLVNGIDTGFEKQSEIAEVKAQNLDGVRTLNSDSHSGRFSLKIGKPGLTGSALCCVINTSVDLSKYNQVTMWVKPKGYNIPLTFYTNIGTARTTLGSIEVSNLKADTWQEVTFTLPSASSGNMTGLYTFAYNNKSVLIDDITFSKSYSKTENWDLNSNTGSSNTLPSVFSYQNNVGVTLKQNATNAALYETGGKVASIENSVTGQITGVQIDSTSQNGQSDLTSTGGAMYLEGLVATNPALYTMSKDGNLIYYYNPSTNSVEKKNRLKNETTQIYNGQIKMIKTNEDGGMLALITSNSSLYLLKDTVSTIPSNFNSKALAVTSGAISMVSLKDDCLYFNLNDELYKISKTDSVCTKIDDVISFSWPKSELVDMSKIPNNTRYSYYVNSSYSRWVNGTGNYYNVYIMRHDNYVQSADVNIITTEILSKTGNNPSCTARPNQAGSMVLFTVDGSYSIITNSDTNAPKLFSLGKISDTYFLDDQMICTVAGNVHLISNKNNTDRIISKLNYSMDTMYGQILYAENYSGLYEISKTISYDKDLIVWFTTQAGTTIKPASNAAIFTAKFSTLPNQAIVQMENGDTYSVDTRTKTSRLLINNMVLYDVLDGGRLLLSDMKDTGRFLIYDPTANSKEVFRLDNRSTGAAFTVQFNEVAKTVYYLNKDNKM